MPPSHPIFAVCSHTAASRNSDRDRSGSLGRLVRAEAIFFLSLRSTFFLSEGVLEASGQENETTGPRRLAYRKTRRTCARIRYTSHRSFKKGASSCISIFPFLSLQSNPFALGAIFSCKLNISSDPE